MMVVNFEFEFESYRTRAFARDRKLSCKLLGGPCVQLYFKIQRGSASRIF